MNSPGMKLTLGKKKKTTTKKPTIATRITSLEKAVKDLVTLHQQEQREQEKRLRLARDFSHLNPRTPIPTNVDWFPAQPRTGGLPKNHGLVWSDKDKSYLDMVFNSEKGHRPSMTLKEIADKLKRTELAVFWRAMNHGLISEDNASFLWRGK